MAGSIERHISAKFGKRYRKGKGRNGVEYKVCCPFCTRHGLKPDRKYKLWINPSKGVYRCWRCNTKGPITDLFANISRFGEDPFKRIMSKPLESIKVGPGKVYGLHEVDEENLGYRYMQRRGFDPAALGSVYGVSYCYDGKVFNMGDAQFRTFNTVVFPLWMDKMIVGWQARLLYNPDDLTEEDCAAYNFPVDDEGEYVRPPKYFTSPGIEKSRVLYNYDKAIESELVVLTEGPTDVLATGPNAVGALGKGISEEQLHIIKGRWKAAVVLLDPDAVKTAHEVSDVLSAVMPTVNVTLRDYDDPGSAPTREIWKQIYETACAARIDLSSYNWGPYWSDAVLKK
jgi:hypothetical protein